MICVSMHLKIKKKMQSSKSQPQKLLFVGQKKIKKEKGELLFVTCWDALRRKSAALFGEMRA